MNLTLRAKLRLPEGCSNAELQAACSRYYAVYKGVLDSGHVTCPGCGQEFEIELGYEEVDEDEE